MKRWCDFLNGPVRTQDYLRLEGVPRDNNYGDWVAIQDTPHELTNTLVTAYSNKLFSKMARVIGNDSIADTYEEQAKNMVDAVMRKYRDESDGGLTAKTQTPLGMLLYFDLVDNEIDKRTFARLLKENIRSNGWKLTSGFIGVAYLCPALSQYGETEAAFKLLEQEEYPSWIYTINQGGTTSWERWNSFTLDDGFGPVSMNSFNHYAFGSIGEWLFSGVLGIRRIEDYSGYRQFYLDPQYGGTLTFARGHYDSVVGRIESSWGWDHDTNDFRYNCTIPANSQATVFIPAVEPSIVTEGGIPAYEAVGIKYLGYNSETRREIFLVESGSYNFASIAATPSSDDE
jgi:alpha-L-rhamnosidase